METRLTDTMRENSFPLILTKKESIRLVEGKVNRACRKAKVFNISTVLAYEDMTDEMAKLPSFQNYDVVLIDDADMFFEFITSGRMKHLKKDAQVMFEKNYLIG